MVRVVVAVVLGEIGENPGIGSLWVSLRMWMWL